MKPTTLTETLRIKNRLGLHTRASAQFVKLASQFKSDVFIIQKNRKVSGKSIMSLLTLAAGKDSEVILCVEGPDQEKAFLALKKLIQNGFGEK